MRRRWVYICGEPVEVALDYVADPKNHDRVLWGDREYQTMGDPRFSSRTQHREYMKQRNLTTADDFTETWKRDEQLREARAKGFDPSRKNDIADAIRKLEAGYKPTIRSDE